VLNLDHEDVKSKPQNIKTCLFDLWSERSRLKLK
jgi:hypothetical protein